MNLEGKKKMHRCGKTIVSTIALFSLISAIALAQSGRGRQPSQPPPKPTPKPNMPATGVIGVPDGGKLVAQDPDVAISRYKLRNGLTVIIRERHSSPLVAVNVSVKAGLINDPDDLVGMSRLTRYMVLKGTSKRPGAAVEIGKHTSELQSLRHLVCRLLLEKKKDTHAGTVEQP